MSHDHRVNGQRDGLLDPADKTLMLNSRDVQVAVR